MRYFIAFAFLFLGSQIRVYSQHSIAGRISGEKDFPLAAGHIHLDPFFTTTDSGGNYSITNIPDGRYYMVISYVGYRKIDTLITVKDDLILNFKLKVDIAPLAEVIVKDARLKSVSDRQEVKMATIEKYSNAALGDLLKEVSGVSTLKTGNAIVKPIINGLHSSRVVIINNNVRLEDQQWGLEHSPNLDVNTAAKVSVIKGASGLQYGGDAIGGIVIIEPQNIPKIDTLFGKTILNGASNGRGGSINSSLFKGYESGWNWNLQGTFKYLGDVEAPEYVLSNTGNRENNFSAGIGFKGETSGYAAFYSYYNAEIGILRASHSGSSADFVNAIDSAFPSKIDPFTYEISAPKQDVQHHLAKLNFYNEFSEFGKLSLQYTFQLNKRLEYDIRRGDDRSRPSLNLNLMTQSINADFETKYADRSNFKLGMSALYQNNYADISTGVRPLIPDYDKYELGIYAIGLFRLNANLDFETGIRYDFNRMDATKFYLKTRWNQRGYDADFADLIIGDFTSQWKTNPVFNYHNFSASAGTKYALGNSWKWLTTVGLASRSPNPSELFSDGLHHATGQIEIGDLRLKQEKALKMATTFSYAGTTIGFEISPYINFINDFMILLPTGIEETIRGTFPVWEYSQVNARLAGIDVTANYDFLKNLNWRSTAAYVYGKDVESGKPLIDMPPLNFTNSVTYTNEKWKNLTIGVTSEIAATQNRFPNNDFFTNVIVNGEPVSTLVRISKPPRGYNQLHFTSAIDFQIFNKSKMTIGFDIRNIMNTNYRDYLNRTRFYADDMGRNFTIQLKINY